MDRWGFWFLASSVLLQGLLLCISTKVSWECDVNYSQGQRKVWSTLFSAGSCCQVGTQLNIHVGASPPAAAAALPWAKTGRSTSVKKCLSVWTWGVGFCRVQRGVLGKFMAAALKFKLGSDTFERGLKQMIQMRVIFPPSSCGAWPGPAWQPASGWRWPTARPSVWYAASSSGTPRAVTSRGRARRSWSWSPPAHRRHFFNLMIR